MRMLAVCLGLTLLQSIPASARVVCTFDESGRCLEGAAEEALLQKVAVLEGNGYGSIAGGLWSGNPDRVATGAATARTAREARDTAIKVCEDRAPVPLTCKEIRTFNNACWYIANGTRGTQVRYAADITWDRAFDACSQDGFTCRTVKIGACVYDDIEEAEQDE